MDKEYDYRNCQSLFGYAQEVHKRSGGICQLCGCGAGEKVDFDLWRQMTVEHLVGESQGGYLKQIRKAIANRFPTLSSKEHERLARRIDQANTVTACSFCNSVTSRYQHSKRIDQLLNEATGATDEVLDAVVLELNEILERKRDDVRWKLQSVRDAFDRLIAPELRR